MKKAFYCGLAWLAFGLGMVGVVVPLLPTTPFLILAAFLFGKGSKRWQEWLLANKFFGPPIRSYLEKRAISRQAKRGAIFTIWIGLMLSAAILYDRGVIVIWGFLALGLVLTVVVSRIRTLEEA